MLKLTQSSTLLLIIICNIFNESSVKAELSVVDTPLPVAEENLVNNTQGKLRIQNYSEYMTPALNGPSVPNPDGEHLVPGFVDGRVWVDYAITEKYRLLYWQRYFVFPFNDYALYDPRFGFRWMQVFDIPGVTTTYDFYFLPGVSELAKDAGRFLEVGIRTNTSYSIPKSRWDLGFVSETNFSFHNGSGQAKNFWGVVAPWTSYRISNRFSTQHWFMFPIKHQQGSFAWDATGMPFVQNGIGWSANDSIWIGAFLNNYLFAPPSLRNSWVSIWLNLTVI